MTLSSGRRQGVLGIDLGTSSVKAVVTDPGGAVIGQASRPYTVLHPQAGWSEIDPNEWLAATIVAVRHAVDSCAHPAIIAIGLSGQMHGLVATNDAGAAVREAMLWSDARAMPQLELYAQLPPAVHARLANPLTAGMAGPMLAWLRTEEPATYRQTRWALQPKDWLRAQLTGQYWTEPSDASATLLYDLSTDYWDPDVVRALGIDPDLLPDLLPYAAHPAGTLTPEGANLLGLAEGTIVAAGAGDTRLRPARGEHRPGHHRQRRTDHHSGALPGRPVDARPAGHPPVPQRNPPRLVRDGGHGQRRHQSGLGPPDPQRLLG